MKRLSLALLMVMLCMALTGCTSLVRISGNSMSPTLKDGDIVTTAPYASPEDIGRFDVILCRYPGRDALFVKRIVGLPGDTVAITDGCLYVNGVRYEEAYVAEDNRDRRDVADTLVPQGCYYVLGDNRRNSNDSRNSVIGALPRACIVREVTSVLWPQARAVE